MKIDKFFLEIMEWTIFTLLVLSLTMGYLIHGDVVTYVLFGDTITHNYWHYTAMHNVVAVVLFLPLALYLFYVVSDGNLVHNINWLIEKVNKEGGG